MYKIGIKHVQDHYSILYMFVLYPPLEITNLPFGINSSLSNIQQFILHLFNYRKRIISQPNKRTWLSIRSISTPFATYSAS